MSIRACILFLVFHLCLSHRVHAQEVKRFCFDFYGDSIAFYFQPLEQLSTEDSSLSVSVTDFFERLETNTFSSLLDTLRGYKAAHRPDDWLYYQLIRKTAQALSPKTADYNQYTLYKCFLLAKSGYDVALTTVNQKLLFFVYSNDEVYDIPSFTKNGKRYVCLNFHDYGYDVALESGMATEIHLSFSEARQPFSYKLTKLPQFRPEHYYEQELKFTYRGADYRFRVKLNNETKQIFINYPVVDYSLYLNSPLSQETYNSLIPEIKKHVARMSTTRGVEYLMHFTRHAFSYEADQQHFGREKYLSPEQTLLYNRSDCEDRAALFYFLVKEIYNIPMVILSFPQHVTVAVKLDKPIGKQIVYKSTSYSICEPTPQYDNLPIGAISAELGAAAYQIAYHYDPLK